jgi:apolipoprotein N-acyltransferase
VQPNIPQEKKWDPRFAGWIMETNTDLTRRAAAERPDLIIWPETATPRPVNRDPNIAAQIGRLANEVHVPILLGSSQATKFRKTEDKRKVRYKNSAYLIPPGAANLKGQRYDKLRLMPFGEYLPYQDVIPWSWIGAEAIDSYLPGEEYTLFQLGDARFAVTICWENLFADLVREFVKRGAQFVVNITNEAWFGETAAPYQFLSMSVFRAVENGVFVVRCANTGISCLIDPCGRVLDRVKNEAGKDIFVPGVLTGKVVPRSPGTFYTRFGDWFAWACLGVTALFLTAGFVARK